MEDKSWERKQDIYSLLNRHFTKQTGQMVNFQILACHFLNSKGIKFSEIIRNKEAIIDDLEKRYPKNKKLREIIEKAINYWVLPLSRPRLVLEVYPGETIVKKTPKDYWIEYLKSISEFSHPPPEFCKSFLLLGYVEPMLAEIAELFFGRLEQIQGKYAELSDLFREATEKFDKPVNLDAYIAKSRYFKELIGGNLPIPTRGDGEEGKKYIQKLSEYFQTIYQRLRNKKELISSLEENNLKLIATDVVDLFYKILEGEIKIILWVIFNLERIKDGKNLVEMDRTIGSYAKLLDLENLEFKYYRDSTGHLNYDLEVAEDKREVFLIFNIREYMKGPIRKEKKSLEELVSLVQILHASAKLFQIFMDAFIRNEELLKKYGKSIEEMNAEFLEDWKEGWWITEMSTSYMHSYKNSDFKTALEYKEKLLEKYPQYDGPWSDKGECLYRLNEFREALGCFRKALDINPQSEKALRLMAASLANLGEPEKAIEYYEKFLVINNQDVWVLNNFAALLIEKERYEEADMHLSRLLKLDPNLAIGYYNKACIAAQTNDAAAAIEYLQKAIEIDPVFKRKALTDTDLISLKNNTDFKNLIKE